MRVGFIDGFDHYPAATGGNGAVDSIWTLVGSADATFLRTGLDGRGKALELNPDITDYRRRRMFDDGATATQISWAFSFVIIRYNDTTDEIARVVDSATATQFSLRLKPGGVIAIYGEGGVELATTSGIVLGTGTIYRACLTVDMTTADATILNMWINGTHVINGAVADFQDSALQNMGGIALYSNGDFNDTNTTYLQWDDFCVLLDTTINQGEVGVYQFAPTADVIKQWTPLTGTDNFAMVDELVMNRDTDYNSSSVVGNKDIFAFNDLTRIPDNIICVSQMTGIRKEETGTRSMNHILVVSGVEYPSPAKNLSQSYLFPMDHFLVNPATLVTWSKADFDALTGGYQDAA